MDKKINETVLIETNFNRSKISTRRIIKWDEIPMPQQWKLERTGYIQSKTEHNIDHIEQTPEGIVYIQMDNTPSRLGNIPRTFSTRSERSYISPLIEDKDYIPYRVSTSQVSERDEQNHHVDKVFKTKENIVKDLKLILVLDLKPGKKLKLNLIYQDGNHLESGFSLILMID
ncbi:hypothetical protein M9H77_08271 [Catharanthus roseus]|uniref:Uncharacterized protein n=1 Tax=Catharanthus roseus TaxID=4058 RepID=A0ACC0BXN0_CATRO|nr:hypothetical protein M9H77_08271 [Catharanthus roseus]